MVAEELLVKISFVLVLAFFVYLFSKIFKLPEVLLLVLTGYLLGNIKYQNVLPLTFSVSTVHFISLFALLLIIFTGNIKVKFGLLDKYSTLMLKFVGTFMILEVIFFTSLFHFITTLSWGISALIAIIITGASPIVINLFKHLKNKSATFLNLETELPSFDAIFAFIFFDIFLSHKEEQISFILIENLKFVVLKFVVGLGAGLFVALIAYKAMQKHYHQIYTPLGILVTILASYSLSKVFGGSGVLALTTTSVILGNLHIENLKKGMLPINFLMKVFYLLVGIAIGTFVKIPFDWLFFVLSAGFYLYFLLVRYLATTLILPKELKTFGEKAIFTLGAAKGFGAITLASLLIQSNIPGAATALTYLVAFLFYSIIVSSVVALTTGIFQRKPKKAFKRDLAKD